MAAPPDLKSMSRFDPSKPAMLYDELNENLFEWQPGETTGNHRLGSPGAETMLDSWSEWAAVHDAERDVWEWDGLLIAGWKPTDP